MENLELITEEQNEETNTDLKVLGLIGFGLGVVGTIGYQVIQKRKKDIDLERDEIRGIILKAYSHEIISETEFDELYTLLLSRRFRKEKVTILNRIAMAYETEEE